MDDRKELHSRRAFSTGRPVPADFVARVYSAVSKRTLAKHYKVDFRTIVRWYNDPDVLKEVAELRAEVRSRSKQRCLDMVPLAVDTLEDVMRGDHPMARVKAAGEVLRIGGVGPADHPEAHYVEGSLEEQARLVLSTAAEMLRALGEVETAARVDAVRDRIVPDAELNIIGDGAEVGDE
jgi:enamine deaminase RidA (YjgF/YER057c/UK114 family)